MLNLTGSVNSWDLLLVHLMRTKTTLVSPTLTSSNDLFSTNEMLKLSAGSSNSAVKKAEDTDEELDNHFAGVISYHFVKSTIDAWIIDSGTSYHMIDNLEKLKDVNNCFIDLR